MLSIFRRQGRPTAVQFCESCSQVCTAECRAQAQLERTRTNALLAGPYPR